MIFLNQCLLLSTIMCRIQSVHVEYPKYVLRDLCRKRTLY